MNNYGKNIVEYTIQRKYKGRIINIKVRDGYIDGRRSTTIFCDYNTITYGMSNASDEKVQYFIERDYRIAKKEIDKPVLVKIKDNGKKLVKKLENRFERGR
jgi:hypothetical protein